MLQTMDVEGWDGRGGPARSAGGRPGGGHATPCGPQALTAFSDCNVRSEGGEEGKKIKKTARKLEGTSTHVIENVLGVRNTERGEAPVHHFGQGNAATADEKPYTSTGYRDGTSTSTWENETQKTAGKNGAESNNQYYLFGCLCHGGYKLYSLLCGTKNRTPVKTRPTTAAGGKARSPTEHTGPHA